MFCSAIPKLTFPNLQKGRILYVDKIVKAVRLGYVSSLFCQSRDGERIRAYKLKCINGFFRGIETFRKYQGKKRAEGRERRIEEPGRRAEDGGRRIADFGRWAAAMDASDHVPDGLFVAGDGERESFEPSIDWDALPENDTNEAKFAESVINIQSKEPVGVAANSAVDWGLDNGQEY